MRHCPIKLRIARDRASEAIILRPRDGAFFRIGFLGFRDFLLRETIFPQLGELILERAST